MTRARGRRREPIAQRRELRAAVTDVGEVLDSAARFLGVRARSESEVRRRLTVAGYPVELVEAALGRLIEQGYLDDEQFARTWVESRDRARPRGERALRLELAQKGVSREIIETVLAERVAARGHDGSGPATGARPAGEQAGLAGHDAGVSPDEDTGGSPDEDADVTPDEDAGVSPDENAARRLLERRRRSLEREADPSRRRQKAYALLARNGFDPDVCRSVAAAFVQSGPGPETRDLKAT